MHTYTTDDFYDNEDWGSLSTPSLYSEFGGGLQYKHLMLNFSFSKGLDNKSISSEYKFYQNKPIKVGLVITF